MTDTPSWTPVTPTALSDEQLHKYLNGAGSTSVTSGDKLAALNPGQVSDPRLLTLTGKSADYGAAATGTYDYSRDAHLQAMDVLMTSWTNAAVSTSEAKPSSSTDILSTSTQGAQNITTVKMLEAAESQKDPDETITVHGDPPTSGGGYVPGFSGGGLGGDANGNSTSRDEAGRMPASVTITPMHSIKTVNVNGIPYVVAPDGQGLDTYQTPSGAWHALPYSMLQYAAEEAARAVLGMSATDGIMSVAYDLAQNGNAGSSDFSQQVQSAYAYSSGSAADLSKIITDVQNRPTNAGDNTWIRGQQNTLASGAQNLLQIRQSLAQWTANDGQYDSTFSTVHGFAPVATDRNYAATMIGNGWSVQDYRWSEAHSDRAVADIKNFYKIILGRDADQAGLTTYTDALGTTMDRGQVASAIATSAEATGKIDSFLQNSFGHVTDDLRNSGAVLLSNLAQAYQTLQSYSSDGLQSLADGYKTTFGQGNLLQSLMPNTWQGWLGLGANLALLLTPPGEAVVASEVLAVGAEDLLAIALDNETNVAVESLGAVGSSEIIPIASSSELEGLSSFVPRTSGSTLDIGNGTIVTQTEGALDKAGALVFKGGDFDAVSGYFKKLSGYSGDLSDIRINSSNIPNGGIIYKIKTSSGDMVLRNITSSAGDWTIVLGNRLSNGVKELKFLFGGE
ncbi:DUF4214 domain-containing protein [Asaia sp. VD9]|uniref:DUF4214 domain-containing protein n=1 Tax=Asaia sp. VD9 TaxID=3081235 RepID=UPI003018DD0C